MGGAEPAQAGFVSTDRHFSGGDHRGGLTVGAIPRPAPFLLAASLCLTGCIPRADTPVHFTDVTAAAGIHFQHTNGSSGRLYTAEVVGSGCAFLDYNRDGKPDLFFVNSSRLPGFKEKGLFYPALYRNNGNGTFTDVTQEAGLTVDCYGMGVAVADYDGDGFEDLYLTALGPHHLFHNNGNGTFTEVTRRAGIHNSRWGTSAAWLDYDRDNRLDLFVCSYARWTPETNQVCPDAAGHPQVCGPAYYKGDSCVLYRNNGNGTFTDVTKQAGVEDPSGKALGVAVWDYDDDGWPDLVVARDRERNLLYRNNQDGTFSERGVEAGLAYSSQGRARAGMGIDTGDTTNSGRESVLVGNFSREGLGQFLPNAQGYFTDVADQTGLSQPSFPFLTFGVAFVDYDNDGFKDIIAANGHINEKTAAGYAMRLLAFHNDGAGTFREVGPELGPAFREPRVWRGLAVGDFNGDGAPDLLVSTCGGKPALLRNDGANQNHWLQVQAIGAGENREGIGTKVTVVAGGRRQIGWIRSGSSYCSQNELVAFFGLGSATQAEAVELRFPDGQLREVKGVTANQRLVVREGKGIGT